MRVEDEGYFFVFPCKGTHDCLRTAAADLRRVIKQPKLIWSAWAVEVYSNFKGVYRLHPNREKAGSRADQIVA